MISIVTLLLIPVAPSVLCAVVSVGRGVAGWLALSWAISVAIVAMILFARVPMQAGAAQLDAVETGKVIGAALASSVYWVVTGVAVFFVVRRLWAGRKTGGEF
ncbi:hypothetical protein BAR1_15785 [Profundibacter amoris]|uniref:Uncharacterized protein n=1 Tax=Profundibacter amoris TaxID=2171755 RepID=A0A347UK86_9RHOB|nr:hypothetical protein BAR1_15785 [Profundibacter amoris]